MKVFLFLFFFNGICSENCEWFNKQIVKWSDSSQELSDSQNDSNVSINNTCDLLLFTQAQTISDISTEACDRTSSGSTTSDEEYFDTYDCCGILTTINEFISKLDEFDWYKIHKLFTSFLILSHFFIQNKCDFKNSTIEIIEKKIEKFSNFSIFNIEILETKLYLNLPKIIKDKNKEYFATLMNAVEQKINKNMMNFTNLFCVFFKDCGYKDIIEIKSFINTMLYFCKCYKDVNYYFFAMFLYRIFYNCDSVQKLKVQKNKYYSVDLPIDFNANFNMFLANYIKVLKLQCFNLMDINNNTKMMNYSETVNAFDIIEDNNSSVCFRDLLNRKFNDKCNFIFIRWVANKVIDKQHKIIEHLKNDLFLENSLLSEDILDDLSS